MIDPKQYKSITAYRLAQAQQAEARDFWRKFRRFAALAVLAVCLILAGVNWPGETLACVMVGLSIAFLWGGSVIYWAGRKHDQEHDLP